MYDDVEKSRLREIVPENVLGHAKVRTTMGNAVSKAL